MYNEDRLSFSELLKLDNYVTVHHKNIQKLAIEVLYMYSWFIPRVYERHICK